MRGWKWVLAGVLLVVGVGATWWLMGGPFWHLMPEQPFAASRAPAPLDYAEDAAWLALPGRPAEAALLPEGLEADPLPPGRDAAVFFIHPTSYGGKTWNAAPDPSSRSQEFLERILAAEASPFGEVGPLYAPHYRQATLFAFITEETDGPLALKLAYGDVRRAFDSFLERLGEGEPYLIVSHSQGSLHAYRLIAERIDPDPALRDRLVAAYTIGFPLPREGLAERFPHIPLCDLDEQTGCLLTYSTWAEGTEPSWKPYHWVGDTLKRQDEDAPRVCINPLSWRDDPARSDASLHLGALVMPELPEGHFTSGSEHSGRQLTSLAPLLPQHTQATCGPQALHVAEQSDPPYGSFIVDGNYHPHDIAMFWGNLRENARMRVQKWHADHRAAASASAAQEAAAALETTGAEE